MANVLNWLHGKKTYLVVAVTFVAGGLTACGVEIPEWVWALLAAAGLGSLRAGVGRADAADAADAAASGTGGPGTGGPSEGPASGGAAASGAEAAHR